MSATITGTTDEMLLVAVAECRLYLDRVLRGIPKRYEFCEANSEGTHHFDSSYEIRIRPGYRINALGYWDTIPTITVKVANPRTVTRGELSQLMRDAIDDVVSPMIGAW